MQKARQKIAVVGGGIAGILSAYLLSQKHTVTLFEKESRLGGHTNTIVIPDGPDAGTAVDTGFIVLNDQTYPTLHAFLHRLAVPVRYANMSFSLYCEAKNFAYGSLNLDMLFAQRRNLLSLPYYRFLLEITRFWRCAREVLSAPIPEDFELKDFYERYKLSAAVIEDYIIPISAAIWSSSKSGITHFPVETFLRFYEKHGLLGVRNQPRWQTVVGGSASYVKAFEAQFDGTVVRDAQIRSIEREPTHVTVTLDHERQSFDQIVIATHADQVLPLLAKPTAEEEEIFSPWRYQHNLTYLHSDTSFLPPIPRAIASWNYRREVGSHGDAPILVTYSMNTLQGLQTKNHYCVTLNPRRLPDERSIVKEISYYHPSYTKETLRSQKRLPALTGKNRTWYAGSYFGFGFHEDAARAAAEVGRQFECTL